MRRLPGAGVVALLILLSGMAARADQLTDPIQAFVEGYDPSGNDFLANVPERTVVLRIRADFDNDGVDDLALSDSSTWGNAGGQWLLFRGQRDGSYVYWGTLFFAAGAAALRPIGRGESEPALYVRMSVSRGTVQMYRLTGAEIIRLSEVSVDLDSPRDRERHDMLLRPVRQLPVEYCKLLEYRRDAAHCWHPGLGLR